jgi:hypothetical protein
MFKFGDDGYRVLVSTGKANPVAVGYWTAVGRDWEEVTGMMLIRGEVPE